MDEYSIRLPEFEGPLDLLLQMIERRELDITRVSLASVADQYLEFITRPGAIELTALADYLVMAARLILIKSRLLLPQSGTDAEDQVDDSAEELARQLRLYRLFKGAAQALRQRELKGLMSFPRRSPPPRLPVRHAGKIEGLSFDTLYEALRRTIAANPSLPTATLIEPLSISIHHKLQRIIELTLHSPRVAFSLLLQEAHSRVQVIVTFLAVLEAVKRRLVRAKQETPFGEIYLERREDAPAPSSAEEGETDFMGA